MTEVDRKKLGEIAWWKGCGKIYIAMLLPDHLWRYIYENESWETFLGIIYMVTMPEKRLCKSPQSQTLWAQCPNSFLFAWILVQKLNYATAVMFHTGTKGRNFDCIAEEQFTSLQFLQNKDGSSYYADSIQNHQGIKMIVPCNLILFIDQSKEIFFSFRYSIFTSSVLGALIKIEYLKEETCDNLLPDKCRVGFF